MKREELEQLAERVDDRAIDALESELKGARDYGFRWEMSAHIRNLLEIADRLRARKETPNG